MSTAALALLVLGVACRFATSVHFKPAASRQRQPCSLHQHAQEEWASLHGRKVVALPCGSFLQTHSSRHTKSADVLSFIQMADADRGSSVESFEQRKTVWVHAYPRSGSSTMLSMVAAAGDARSDSRLLGQTFSLFEPCHDGDAYEPWMLAEGCGRLLAGVARCDFTGINQLWGWPDSHTTSNHSKFSQQMARELCEQSRMTAFKTVDYGHNLTEYQWLLQQHPQLRIIDIVRDPRGIYASWKTTEPFSKIIGTEGFYTLPQVCDTFAANLDLSEETVHHVIFERLTQDPSNTMKAVYDFLGLPFTRSQEEWVNKTFNAVECPEPKPWEVGFTDCHQDSTAVSEKWRNVLSDDEKRAFAESNSCQRVVEAYGFAPV